jgi:hypothetical protein
MKKPTIQDLALHAISLQIAAAHRTFSLAEPVKDYYKTEKDDLILAFRNTRRCISADENGDRWGAEAAYNAMQGRI